MTREEFDARVRPGKQLAAQDPDAYLDHIDATNRPSTCELCEDQGERLIPIDRDEFGVYSTEAVPCVCEAGRELAERLAASSSSSAAQVQQLEARPDESGVSGSLVRGGDPDPSLNPRKAA